LTDVTITSAAGSWRLHSMPVCRAPLTIVPSAKIMNGMPPAAGRQVDLVARTH
jgi:hypothetical protein